MTLINPVSCVKIDKGGSIFSPSVKLPYDFYGLRYRDAALNFLEDAKVDQYLKLTLEFLQDHPYERRYIFGAFNVLQLNYGRSSVFKEIVSAHVDASNRVLSVGTTKYGLPPCFEEYWAFNRIGELVEQTAFASYMHKLKPDQQKPLIVVDEIFPNYAFIPYLLDGFELISDKGEAKHVRNIEFLAPYSTFYYKYSNTKYGHNKTFYGDIYPDLVKQNITEPAFRLADSTYEVAQSFLRDYDITDKDEFVLLHLRESGFIINDRMNKFIIGDHPDYQRYRNTNPMDYLGAIDFILSQGLKVVRIGNDLMTPLPEKKGLIDLTMVDRPGEVDIYLSAMATFYYGSLSGPFSLFRHFNKGIALITNSIDYGLSIPNSLMQMLPMRNKADERILSLQEIDDLDLFGVCSAIPFSRNNLEPVFPKSEDHIRSVKDLFQFKDGGNIVSLNKQRKKAYGIDRMLSYFDTASLDLF